MNIYFIFILIIIILIILIKYEVKKYKSIILIRYHLPTKYQIYRFNLWKNSSLLQYKYIFLTDNYNDSCNKENLYCITADEVFNKYSSLINTGICRNKYKQFYMNTFHIEHVLLCWKLLIKKYKFDYMWVVEQDIGFSGNINQLFKEYDNISSDLISTNYSVNNLGWYYCCTNNYMKYRKDKLNNTGYKTSEHIQRWSTKYIKKVYKLLNKNIHSQSEHASIEFLLFLKLTFHNINKKDIGYKYKWNSRVSKEEWIIINNKSQYKNKLYHSLKF